MPPMADHESSQTTTLTVEQALGRAISHHQAGQLQNAEQLYRAILQVQPGHADANHNLGVLAVQLNQFAVSLPHFKAALDTNPNQAQYWLSYVDALIKTNQADVAAHELERCRALGSNQALIGSLEELLDKSRHGKTGELGSAEKPKAGRSQNKSISGKAKNPSPQEIESIVSMFNQGHFAEVVVKAKALTTRYPQHGFGWKVLGAAYQELGRNLDALSAKQKAVQLWPNDADVHSNLANTLQELGRYAQAEKSCRAALYLQPDHLGALCNLGNALNKLNRFVEAETVCRRALSLKPDFAPAWNLLGIAQASLNRIDEAMASYQQALKYRPDYAEALFNVGNAWSSLARWDEAERSYLRALALTPNYPNAHNNLGLVYQGTGRFAEAVLSYKRAIDLKSMLSEAHNNLGTVFLDLGQLDEAARSCQQALHIDRGFASAHINLGTIQYFMDDLPQSVLSYQKVLEYDPAGLGLEAAVNLAILSYLSDDTVRCRRQLQASQPILEQKQKKQDNSRHYWRQLDQLLSLDRNSKLADTNASQVRPLYVIGESHSLSAHGARIVYRNQEMRCTAEWIIGCKQWHLGNAQPNKYKHKFNAIMARLPGNSVVLLTIGEIDCRHDEGMIKAAQKNPHKPINEILQATVDAYVQYVVAVNAQHGHQVIVCGVPAPNKSLGQFAGVDLARQASLIRDFNARLKDQAMKSGMDFLDVHSLTDRSDGISNGEWHLDNFHLLPMAVEEAFRRHSALDTVSA